MTRKAYNKLVRDRIPEIIESEGRECTTETMSVTEFRAALLEKLVEEAQEAMTASEDKLAIELADLLEVLEAVIVSQGMSEEQVRSIQTERRRERGGFDKRIKLLWAE